MAQARRPGPPDSQPETSLSRSKVTRLLSRSSASGALLNTMILFRFRQPGCLQARNYKPSISPELKSTRITRPSQELGLPRSTLMGPTDHPSGTPMMDFFWDIPGICPVYIPVWWFIYTWCIPGISRYIPEIFNMIQIFCSLPFKCF